MLKVSKLKSNYVKNGMSLIWDWCCFTFVLYDQDTSFAMQKTVYAPLVLECRICHFAKWQIRHSNTKGTSRSIAHIMGDIWAESLACHSSKISRWRKIYCAGACPVCITSGDLSAGSPDSRAAKLTNSRIGRSKPWRPGGVVQRRKWHCGHWWQ